MKTDDNPYHRRSIRLKGYDYSLPGAYFITILTYKRIELFGQIINGTMKLSGFGEIAEAEWFNTAKIRLTISLYPDEMVVMPDHIHGIIRIREPDADSKGAASLRPYVDQLGQFKPGVTPGSLGAIVRAYKAAVTYRINSFRKSPGSPVWHRNYFDHIIRNDDEFRRIWDYIDANPQNWDQDRLHPLK